MSVVFEYQNKVSRVLDILFKSGIISDDEKKTFKTSRSMLGIMYGLPKVHKPDLPMRPILSTVNSHNYRLKIFG